MKFISAALIPLLHLTHVYADYADNAHAAINTLQNKWYDANTGLWCVNAKVLPLHL
jgi:hypothetical protein